MAKLAGLIVGGLLTWLFGFDLASLFGSWGFVGLALPFLIGYVPTASMLDAALSGMGREILSSSLLRPVKGFSADVLVWLLSAWLLWKAAWIVVSIEPALAWWVFTKLMPNDPGLGTWAVRFYGSLFIVSLILSVSRYLKILIGRATRPFRRMMHGLTFGMGGSSRFNGMLEEWANPWKPGMLMLGTSQHSRGWKVGVRDDRHFITIATSRSGKGRSGIIPNQLTWPGSALVIDPKGQNAAITLQARKKLGQSVFVVDPFHELENVGLDAGIRFRFNPMAELRLDDLDIVEQCGQLADALVKPDPHADAFWLDSAKQLIAGLIAHVLTWPGIPDAERTLITVHRLLSTVGDENSQVMIDMRQNSFVGGLPMRAAAQIDTLGDRAAGSVIGTAMEQTKWLDSLAMQDCLGSSEFTLADLKKRPTTVYLVLPPAYLNEHGRFLRLFVNLSLKVASQGGKPKHSVLFVLDEFYALGTMSELAKSAGLLAGFGVKLWPIVQNLGQLKELYPDNWETFLGNAGLWQVFACNDETTARYMSERLGHHIAWRKMKGADGRMEWMPQGAAFLRTSVEFARESSRESGSQIVFQEGGSAFVLRRSPYDKTFHVGQYEPDPFEPPPRGLQAVGGIGGLIRLLKSDSKGVDVAFQKLLYDPIDAWMERREQRSQDQQKAEPARPAASQAAAAPPPPPPEQVPPEPTAPPPPRPFDLSFNPDDYREKPPQPPQSEPVEPSAAPPDDSPQSPMAAPPTPPRKARAPRKKAAPSDEAAPPKRKAPAPRKKPAQSTGLTPPEQAEDAARRGRRGSIDRDGLDAR